MIFLLCIACACRLFWKSADAADFTQRWHTSGLPSHSGGTLALILMAIIVYVHILMGLMQRPLAPQMCWAVDSRAS
jgi:hypothetical protein